MYATGRLIRETIFRKHLKKSGIVRALGYRNIDKALRKLDKYIRGEEECSEEYLYALSDVMGIEREKMADAISETKDEAARKKRKDALKKEAYERKHFKPHVHIETAESTPSSITMVAFCGVSAFKCIQCPDGIASLPMGEQIMTVRKIITDHYRERRGMSMFGDITGYIYRRTYDNGIAFSIEGEVVNEDVRKIETVHEGEIHIGTKTITGGILPPR